MWSAPRILSLREPVSRLAVYDSGGRKPVLFFVHGLGITGRAWKDAISLLQDRYRCIAVDLPGHGASRNERGNFSMAFYALAVRSCIEALRLDEVTLVGHSMGGQVSVIVALQIPSVVQRLALVASAGVETFTTEEAHRIAHGADLFYRAPVDLAQVMSLYQAQIPLPDERLRELAQEHISQQSERFAQFSQLVTASIKGMLREPVRQFLPHVHQPTLVLYGENDRLIPNKWVHPTMTIHDVAAAARQDIHDSKVEVLAGYGHYLQFEAPQLFAQKLDEFCRSGGI